MHRVMEVTRRKATTSERLLQVQDRSADYMPINPPRRGKIEVVKKP